jgi:hypothetical protein
MASPLKTRQTNQDSKSAQKRSQIIPSQGLGKS